MDLIAYRTLTVKMIYFWAGTFSSRMFPDSSRRYSWIFPTTTSGSSPDRISWSSRDDASLDNAQYSLRFMSSPLTSSLSTYFPSTSTRLIAAYFFLACKSSRRKMLSISISKSLYRSLTERLKSLPIFRASSILSALVLIITESVSPYITRSCVLSARSLVLRRISRPLKVVSMAKGLA